MRSIRLFDLLMGFSRALDMVTPVLAGHHLRVAFLSQIIAERLRLSASSRRYMLMASMLHDIGAIPLKSETKDLVFEHNKALHCRAGWAFCKTAGLPRPVCDMVLHHHTEWDSYAPEDQNALPANCIHMADRIDIALRGKQFADLHGICRMLQAKTSEYAPENLAALEFVADDAALNSLVTSPQKMEQHLASTFGMVVLGPVQLVDLCGLFSQTIDSKSPFTATHSMGVAHTARMLLKLSRMADSGDLTTMFIAGLLHDIGKLAIPLEILEKPTSLTPTEILQIQQHAQNSLELLGSIPGFTCVREWGGGITNALTAQATPNKSRGAASPCRCALSPWRMFLPR